MPKIGMAPVRRMQVIRAVVQCLAESGWEKLTLDSVARKAKVSKGIVTYYFKGKRGLLLNAFASFLAQYNEVIEQVIRPEMSAREMVEIVMDVTFGEIPSIQPTELSNHTDDTPQKNDTCFLYDLPQKALGKAMVHFFTKTLSDEGFKKVYCDAYASYLKGMVAIIDYGIKTGEFREVDARKAAYGIMTLLDGSMLFGTIGFEPLTGKETIAMCKDFAHHYLSNRR